MKVSARKEILVPAFTPITIEVTFESMEEARAFYSLMNFSPICEWLGKSKVYAGSIREAMSEGGVPSSGVAGISAALKGWFNK